LEYSLACFFKKEMNIRYMHWKEKNNHQTRYEKYAKHDKKYFIL